MRSSQWFIGLLLGAVLSSWGLAASTDPTLASTAKEQGFFFFYSSSCPHCQRFAPILKQFSERYGFSVVAISVDGGFLPDFPDAVMNAGQTTTFQVTTYPSLFLVNPKLGRASLVTEGNIDERELENRVLKLSLMRDGETL